ncbi:SDR family NAD(P)-dependent oxidoreductase [Mycolicibacterium mageritense]|uniref:SDR family NAD(P)-dependent oxidoreductase n=1 Tax=Mycolicibacterium mageritense TaxID=53462 RepID=UPI001E5F9994|nr:SDR family NAD(P)-dependent oxidoreductase [Mycolicibacterium mageritense]GJJ21226.1 short-chain dehydrogenase [Mycolicibacterium mageritense]
MTRRFHGKVVVITGVNAGLGRALAHDFTSEGASIVGCDLAEISTTDAVAFYQRCDVTSAADVEALIANTRARFGRIDVLVNNAGAVSRGSAASLAEADWDRIMDTNAKGTFLACRGVIPVMSEQPHGGAIVNIASQAAQRPERYLSHYCAAKAAVAHYSRALALELAPAIRVNCVNPGFVETDMSVASLEGYARETGIPYETARQARRDVIPMGRFQQPHDIAEAVMFLASESASEITGDALEVSGGQVLG